MSGEKCVFVTGGAGYIGSHCVLELLENDYNVIAIDNFANSVSIQDANQSAALKRVELLTGKHVKFSNCDLLDKKSLDNIFRQNQIDCVIHFAAMKAVGESMDNPLLYYRNNVIGLINLLEVMQNHNSFKLVFSSSCTVYGEPKQLPITEDHPVGENITNVYGNTKYFIEVMLKDMSRSDPRWNFIILRYFNPVGAHPSGLIGEDPTKPFANIMPYIAQVAIGKKPYLEIFGDDYETPDGSGVRDYIHIMDLASGHVKALEHLFLRHQGVRAYNLGTGEGVSVFQLIKTFEKCNGVQIPYKVMERRSGDISTMYANASLAEKDLDWKPERSLEEMCKDFWKWQTLNPNGYGSQQEEFKTNGFS